MFTTLSGYTNTLEKANSVVYIHPDTSAKRLGVIGELICQAKLIGLGERVYRVEEDSPYDLIVTRKTGNITVQVKTTRAVVLDRGRYKFNVSKGGHNRTKIPYKPTDYDILATVAADTGFVLFHPMMQCKTFNINPEQFCAVNELTTWVDSVEAMETIKGRKLNIEDIYAID